MTTKLLPLRLLACLAMLGPTLLPAAPKNVILFVADGMGYEQVKAARLYAGASLAFEQLPHTASCTTDSLSGVTDSAAAATAIATGIKVANGVISQDTGGNPLITLLEGAAAMGKDTGLVTTAYLTHATPAAFGAHESSRSNYSAIALDYLNDSQPNVLFGGGGNGLTVAASESAGYVVASDSAGFAALDTAVERLSAQFGNGYMPYVYDHLDSADYPFPMLDAMTAMAIDALDDNLTGFFLMVEAGRIDHACHANLLEASVHETLALSDAVQVALGWASGRDDTLVLVTADHETGGLTVTADNGPDAYPTVSWSSTSHTGAAAPVYAAGVNAELVGGVLDNTDFFEICTVDNSPVGEATNPAPADSETAVALDVTLLWTPGVDAVSHRVYLGEQPDLSLVDPVETTVPSLAPAGLFPGTTYYWRVDEVSAQQDVAPGPVWSFTTTVAPGPPTGLTPADGAADLPTSTELAWQPDALSEHEEVFFGIDPGALALVAQTTATGYDPGPLDPGVSYFWQVVSVNSAGTAASPVQSFATAALAPPTIVGSVAESTPAGAVAGSLADTWAQDGVYEALTEVQNVPNKNGFSTLDHSWEFQLDGAVSAVFRVIALHTASVDGDDFEFSYSTDGETYQPMLTVIKTIDTGSPQSFGFPGGLDGTVVVRVRDTDHTKKNQVMDTLWIDEMVIEASFDGVIKQYAATQPQPADGTEGIAPDESTVLSWKPGDDAVFHDVYLVTEREDLEDSYSGVSPYAAGLTEANCPVTVLLEALTWYYWRVDEFDAEGKLLASGTIWSFETGPDASSVATTVSAQFAVDTGRGSKGGEYVRATVTLVDDLGGRVAGAQVIGRFGIDGGAQVSAVSDDSGVAVLQSLNQGKKPPVFFEIDDVIADGLVYVP